MWRQRLDGLGVDSEFSSEEYMNLVFYGLFSGRDDIFLPVHLASACGIHSRSTDEKESGYVFDDGSGTCADNHRNCRSAALFFLLFVEFGVIHIWGTSSFFLII